MTCGIRISVSASKVQTQLLQTVESILVLLLISIYQLNSIIRLKVANNNDLFPKGIFLQKMFCFVSKLLLYSWQSVVALTSSLQMAFMFRNWGKHLLFENVGDVYGACYKKCLTWAPTKVTKARRRRRARKVGIFCRFFGNFFSCSAKSCGGLF